MTTVYFTAGDRHGWAIDEDLRLLRGALRGTARETSLGAAEVVHSPFWMALDQIEPEELSRRFVIANADNPPFFYTRQPEFARAQKQVNLWVARSQEALAQFKALRLPVAYVPYTIDTEIFKPLVADSAEKIALRQELSLPEKEYLIANFHRDTEGGDLTKPKTQKAPELFLAILRKLKKQGHKFAALLAGPRRHWLRQALEAEGIPFHFVGKTVEEDDFGVNILDRPTLAKLYAAADVYVVPSRWEGGPQSVMEAAACRCPIVSTSVGLAMDILDPACLFHTADEAATLIASDITSQSLAKFTDEHFEKASVGHSSKVLPEFYSRIYQKVPSVSIGGAIGANLRQFSHTLSRRFAKPGAPRSVSIAHAKGHDEVIDEIIENVRTGLTEEGVEIAASSDGATLIGTPEKAFANPRKIQFVSSSTDRKTIRNDAIVVAQSVQDVVNLRQVGLPNACVVIPFIFSATPGSGPLEIEPGDKLASVPVWNALAGGRQVIYPKDSAYYEQVFHAGVPYSDETEREQARKSIAACAADFAEVTFIPDLTSSTNALMKLL